VRRDLTLAWRRWDDVAPILFYVVVTAVPLATTPDLAQLRSIAAGIVWEALLASMLTPNRCSADVEDGSMEQRSCRTAVGLAASRRWRIGLTGARSYCCRRCWQLPRLRATVTMPLSLAPAPAAPASSAAPESRLDGSGAETCCCRCSCCRAMPRDLRRAGGGPAVDGLSPAGPLDLRRSFPDAEPGSLAIRCDRIGVES
jgi:hypothetical protein